jgi:hypothetical protein
LSLQKASSLPSLTVRCRRDELLQSGKRRRYQRRGSRSANMLHSVSVCVASAAAQELAANVLRKRYSRLPYTCSHSKETTEHGCESGATHSTPPRSVDDDVSIASNDCRALAALTEALKLSEPS